MVAIGESLEPVTVGRVRVTVSVSVLFLVIEMATVTNADRKHCVTVLYKSVASPS
jgi:hypothetical protein